jgi:uncharacterized protein with ParB-like and HNH nuclease domain
MNAKDLAISELLNVDVPVVYNVPRYQRNFTWGNSEWEEFFNDINSNDKGYFLGSIICINQGNDPFEPQLELVDGQQRMVTLSLLYAAVYSKLNEQRESLNDDQKNQLYNLKLRLILRKDPDKIRVIPQILNNNQMDYRVVLNNAGVLRSHGDIQSNAKRKYVFKAYQFFLNKLDNLSGQSENKVDAILELLEKVDNTRLIMISVESHAHAYMLFESLNNRGVELSAVDLIKNKLFHSLKEPKPGDNDPDLLRWNNLLNYLGEDNKDYKVRERFFRQYYNAFRRTLLSDNEKSGIKNASIATKSNIISIYEKLIAKNPDVFFNEIIKAGYIYSIILGRTKDENFLKESPLEKCSLKKSLLDLGRIEGTPSYLLLLYLFEKREKFELKNEHLCDIVKFLVHFFVRRNLTDRPATNSLTPLFMKIVDEISSFSGDGVVEKIKYELASVSSSDKEFREYLEGPIYSESSSVDRFILCAIESSMWPNGEPIQDLWRKENGKYIWTIEHIFPQGKNIPPCWIKMIAEGDEARAKDLQAKNVHRLGNLTLTGYNPNLSNMCFEEKRDRIGEDGNPIGYKNRLHLNDDIKIDTKNTWTINDIETRTTQLVEKALELFALEDENKPIKNPTGRYEV